MYVSLIICVMYETPTHVLLNICDDFSARMFVRICCLLELQKSCGKQFV